MGTLIKDDMFEVRLVWRWKNYGKRCRMKTYGAKYLVRGYACLSEEQVCEFGPIIARRVVERLAGENAVTRLASNFDTQAGDNWGGWADVSVRQAGTWYEIERLAASEIGRG